MEKAPSKASRLSPDATFSLVMMTSAAVLSGADFEDEAMIDTSKWPKSPPTVFKPFLTSFTKFTDLPIEIRNIIWRLTLQARAIDISYRMDRGFYSRTKVPIALRVCHESRMAVVKDYPLCFGSVLFAPTIVCNFSTDTLLFDWIWQNRIGQFLAGMSDYEIKHVQSIAVHYLIDENMDLDHTTEDRAIDLFRRAVRNMPAMREFRIVHSVDENYHGHGYPAGEGVMELFEDFTYEWQQFMYREGIHLDDEEGEFECQELPNCERLTVGFDLPKLGAIWGWRPIELPMRSPQWY